MELDEVKETTQRLGYATKKSQPETPQLSIENAPNRQPMENNEGVVYVVELENTLKNMTDNSGFFKTYCDCEHGWMWNGYPIKNTRGTEIEINHKKFNITPAFQKVLSNSSNKPLKKINDKDREILDNILQSLDFENYKAIRGESKPVRFKQSKTNFKKQFEGPWTKNYHPFKHNRYLH